MNTHVVTKSLPRGEVTIDIGTKVDASGWPHRRLLEEQRYIRPLSEMQDVSAESEQSKKSRGPKSS